MPTDLHNFMNDGYTTRTWRFSTGAGRKTLRRRVWRSNFTIFRLGMEFARVLGLVVVILWSLRKLGKKHRTESISIDINDLKVQFVVVVPPPWPAIWLFTCPRKPADIRG